jgi:hypothetical protein
MPDSRLVEAERGACSINDGPSRGDYGLVARAVSGPIGTAPELAGLSDPKSAPLAAAGLSLQAAAAELSASATALMAAAGVQGGADFLKDMLKKGGVQGKAAVRSRR